jgi:hypothetical protein
VGFFEIPDNYICETIDPVFFELIHYYAEEHKKWLNFSLGVPLESS